MRSIATLFLFILAIPLYSYSISDYNLLLSGHKDLRSADLSNVTLFQMSLKDIDFSGADLSGSQMILFFCDNCKFNGTKFNKANIGVSYFLTSNLENVEFNDTEIGGTNFVGCKLKNIRFHRSRFTSNRINDCELSNVIFSESTIRDFEFSRSKSENIWIIESKITRAQIINVVFSNSKWTNTSLSQTIIYASMFQRVDFSTARFMQCEGTVKLSEELELDSDMCLPAFSRCRATKDTTWPTGFQFQPNEIKIIERSSGN